MNYSDVLPFVKDGKIAWTMTTSGYKFYTLNLIKSLKEVANVPWTLCIICCDSESFRFFRLEGYECLLYRGSNYKGQVAAAAFGTEDFAVLNRIKIDLLLWFASCKEIRDTMYLDGDIVVRRDPWPVLEGSFVNSNTLLFQCDCHSMSEHECGNACTGFIVERKGDLSTTQLYEFDEKDWILADKQDQPYVGNRLKKFGIPYTILSRRLFGNGAWQKGMTWKQDDWVLLHYNHRIGMGKKIAMKKDQHWRIPY